MPIKRRSATNYKEHPALAHPEVLIQALASSGICVIYQDKNFNYQWAENLPSLLQDKWQKNCLAADLFSAENNKRLQAVLTEIQHSLKTRSIELMLNPPSRRSKQNPEHNPDIWYRFSIQPYFNAKKKLAGFITTGIDVSELKQREKILKILLREVSHRSKNLLAITQSLARQTANFSQSLPEFIKDFEGRIQALVQTQDLITDANWGGVYLSDLLTAHWKPYKAKHKKIISFSGDNPYFTPHAAIYIGLALHELITHSLKAGLLHARKNTPMLICQQAVDHENCDYIELYWQEIKDLRQVSNEQVTGFSNKILTKIVPAAVNGKVKLAVDTHDFCYKLLIPQTEFDL